MEAILNSTRLEGIAALSPILPATQFSVASCLSWICKGMYDGGSNPRMSVGRSFFAPAGSQNVGGRMHPSVIGRLLAIFFLCCFYVLAYQCSTWPSSCWVAGVPSGQMCIANAC